VNIEISLDGLTVDGDLHCEPVFPGWDKLAERAPAHEGSLIPATGRRSLRSTVEGAIRA